MGLVIINKLKLIESLENGQEAGVLEYLLGEPVLNPLRDNMVKLGNVSFAVDQGILARSLLAETNRIGAAAVADNVAKFFELDSIPGIEVLALNGIEIDQCLQLTDDIQLVPFKEIPDSYIKATYDINSVAQDYTPPNIPKEIWDLRRPSFLMPFNRELPRPSAALICNSPSTPKFITKFGEDDFKRQSQLSHASHINELIELLNCLTLVGPSSPTPIVYWWQADSWVLNIFNQGSGSAHFEYDLINQTNRLVSGDEHRQMCIIICESYLALSTSLKNKLHIPLDRLNRTIRRRDRVDKAIELGVAMEGIFLTDDGDDTGELSFRLRLRAAWLLGENYEEREKIMKVFSKVYGYRSQAVHNGKIKASDAEVDEFIKDGINMVSKAVEKITRTGAWPDWRALTLGHTRI